MKRDRNGDAHFKLAHNIIHLGEAKPFGLKMNVDVEGKNNDMFRVRDGDNFVSQDTMINKDKIVFLNYGKS